MTLGPIMVDVQGLSLTVDEEQMLQHPLVGGVILFSRNFESVEQIKALVAAIHAVRTPRLLVAVDQEGGRVQRFREGFVRLPAVRRLGELYDKDRPRALDCAETTGWLMAAELLSLGIDISFAPVLDLDYGVSTVIGDRAFHRSAEAVADIAHAYIIGMRKAGMAATGKHFPGHGAVHADSHTDLPVDARPLVDLQTDDMLAFERMIHFDMAAMMMAHVVYPDVDELPASFSHSWINNILRQDMGFQGVVFSDDLSMVAAHSVGGYVKRAELALQAGCDMILICNSLEGRDEVLENLSIETNPVSKLRLVRMHGHFDQDWQQLHDSEEWKQAEEVVKTYDPDPLLDMDIE